jgi:hypothetical protein
VLNNVFGGGEGGGRGWYHVIKKKIPLDYYLMPLQEITAFFTENFNKKNRSYDFFAFMFNLTKMPF